MGLQIMAVPHKHQHTQDLWSSLTKYLSGQERVHCSAAEGVTWISDSLLDRGVPVTVQACRRHREEAFWAATLLLCATSCASSSRTLQKPQDIIELFASTLLPLRMCQVANQSWASRFVTTLIFRLAAEPAHCI